MNTSLVSSRYVATLALALAVLMISLPPALAQSPLYWAGGTTNIVDGTAIPTTWSSLNGTWNTTTENFATNTSGTTYDPWTNGSIFSGNFAGWTNDTTTQITLGSNVTVGGIGMVINRGNATQNLRVDLNATSARTLTLDAGTVIDVRGGGSNLTSPGSNMAFRINTSGTNVSMVGSDGFTKKGNYAFEIRGAHNSLTGTVNILHDATANDSNNSPGWVVLTNTASLAGVTRFNISASGYSGGGTSNFGTWGVFQVADSTADQLNNSSVINLSGVGIFQFTGCSTSTETIGNLRLDSGGILDISGNGGTGILQITNGIERANDRAQLSVRVQGNGTNGSVVNLGTNHGLGTNVPVPWITDATKARFGMVDASNNLAWFAPTDVTGNLNTITNINTNYRVVGNATSFGANTNLASGAAANTLGFYRSNNGGALTVNITDTLTIGGGGIATANDNNSLDVTIAGTSSTSLTTSGGTPLYLASGFSTAGGTLNINAPITGAIDVIKGGLGGVKFGGTNQANTYTGMTYVNGGTLAIGKNDGVNSIVGNIMIRNGGILDLDQNNQIADSATVTVVKGGYFKTDSQSETIANLAGAGMVVATVTSGQTQSLNMTSSVAPGDGGIGTLILNRGGAGNSIFRMNNSANFTMELSASGGTPDRVDFFNYNGGEFVLVGNNRLNLSLVGNQTDGRYTVSLFRFYSNDGTTLTNSGLTSGLTVGTTGTIIGTPTLNYNAGGSTIDISYSVGAMYYTEPGTTYTVATAQTYNAATYIRNGATLNATIAGVLPTSTPTALVMDDTGTGNSILILGANQTVASLSGNTTSSINLGSHTLNMGSSSGNTTFAGGFSGNGILEKTGASTQILTGNSSAFTGAINIAAGSTLSFNASPALGATSGIALTNGATLAHVGSGTTVDRTISVTSGTGTIENTGSGLLTLSGPISQNGTTLALKGGSNGITVSGSIGGTNAGSNLLIDGGFTTLSNANNYNGATALINGATLTVGAANALPIANGRSNISLDATGSGGSTLALDANQSIASLSGAASSTITLGSNTLTIGASSGNSTYAGGIIGSGVIVKDGASTLTISGTTASHTGGTLVNAGTLALTGSLTAGETSVNNGGTLLGTGSAAAVTVNNGGIIAPGASAGAIGTLSVSNITLGGGGGYNWELTNVTGSAGAQWDLITVSGAATITATAGSPFTIFLRGNPTGWDPTVSQSTGWNIMQWGSVSGFDANAFAVNASYFGGAAPTGSWTFSNAGGYLNLAYAAPSSADIWTAGSGNWSTGANWQSGSVPENGTPLEFAGAGGTSTNNGALTSINGITFGSSAGGSYSINGSSLQIGGGGITNSSAYSQAVSLDLSLTALQTFDAGSANLTLSGNIATSGHRITGAGAGSVTISGAISGLGGLTKTDSGTLVLSANNTYTGTTILSAGTLRLEGSGLLGGGNYSAAISNSGYLILDTSSNQILSGAISGNGSLVKNNSSILTLSGSNTHSGGTTLNAGTLRINNASALGTGPLVIGGAATIDNTSGSSLILITNNTQNWNSDFTFTGSNNLDLGTGAVAMNATRTLTVSANTLTVGGAISGSGFGLTKNGTGTLVLSGNNSYTGATTIHAGTLTIDANGRLAAGSYSANISNNGTLRFASSLNQTLSGVLSGSGSLIKEGTSTLTLGGANTFTGSITVGAGRLSGNASSLQGNITNDAELEFSETGAAAYSSVISGSGSLIKTGAGNLTLSGANTYTGATTISAGTLTLGSSGRIADTSNLNVSGTFNLAGFNETLGSIEGSGSIVLGSGTLTTNASSSTTFSGALSGSGGVLVKRGSGNITLTGNNTNTGGIIVAEGRLLAGANTNLGAASATLTLDGGTFVMTTGFTTSRSIVLGSSGGTLDTTALGVLTSGTLSGVISGNAPLTIAANGDLNAPTGARLVISGNNTFTGTVTITSGIVGPNSASAFGNGSNVIVLDGGGLLGYLANTTVSNDIVLGASGGTFRVYGGGPSLLVNGTISGSGKLDITDNGPATLARANTFTGDTRIMASSPSNQSTLNLGHVDALSGSTLDLQASDRGVLNFTVAGNNTYNIGGLKGSRNITSLGANTISLGGNNQNTTYSGTINGTGGLAKAGNGTLTLNGSNTYTGGTTVNSGTLVLGHATNTLADTGALTLNGGVLSIGSNNETIGAFTLVGGSLIGTTGTLSASSFSLQNGTVSAILGGAGSLTKTGADTLTLSTANSFSGGITLANGTLILANTNAPGSGTITQSNASSLLVFDTTGTISNAMSIYNAQALKTVTLSGGIMVNNATFDVEDGETLTLSNTINGTGGVTKNGAGTLVLGGSNSYAGATVVNAGILQANNANALGANTTVTVNGGSLLVSHDDAINGKNITLNSTSLSVAGLAFQGNYTGTAGLLTLSKDSILDLGLGSVVLRFSDIVGLAEHTLKIYNWTGETLWGGNDRDNTDQIYVTANLNAPSRAGELGNISFYSDFTESSFLGTGFQLAGSGFYNNQVIPVPEPETWATGALLLFWSAFWARRKYRRHPTAA